MKAFFLALPFIIIPTSLKAVDKEEVRFALEFERMKLRSDYLNDLKKEGKLFILWVSYENQDLYKWLRVNRPDAIHSFIEKSKLQDVEAGIVVGIRQTDQFHQAKAFRSADLGGLKAKEVIQSSLGLLPGQTFCPGGVCKWNYGSKY